MFANVDRSMTSAIIDTIVESEPVVLSNQPSLSLPGLWRNGFTGRGVRIGIFDTGLNAGTQLFNLHMLICFPSLCGFLVCRIYIEIFLVFTVTGQPHIRNIKERTNWTDEKDELGDLLGIAKSPI